MKKFYFLYFLIACMCAAHSHAQEYKVWPAEFNSGEADFAPQYYKDGVIFCSTRAKTVLSFVDDSLTTKYYTDLYFSQKKGNGKFTSASLFSPELTTLYNEGPLTFTDDENTVYYTGNIEPRDAAKRNKIKEYKLGIFVAQFDNGKWQKSDPFPFNTNDCKFDIAHPALAPGDTILYFASNMQGGLGGTDIYRCYWRNGRWSVPVNLGVTINTRGNELFPFVDEGGNLYFSSDGLSEEMGLDIFVAKRNENGFRKPSRLPAPVNTAFDDFGYVAKNKGHEGYFSSNRIGLQDDIFVFSKPVPDFDNCHENSKPRYCYEIEDVNIMPIDSLPLVYEWDLGDGTKKRGLKIRHCFKEIGRYEVKLNVIDTTTRMLFMNVSNAIVDVEPGLVPYMDLPDTVKLSDPVFMGVEAVTATPMDQFFWIIDDGEHQGGTSASHQFSTPGMHTIKLGMVSNAGDKKLEQKSCVQKMIVVLPDSVEWTAMKYEMREEREYQTVQMTPRMTSLKAGLPANGGKAYYRVVFHESAERTPFNNPVFSKVNVEIVESRADGGGYEYAVGSTTNMQAIYPIFKSLTDAGYTDLHIESSGLKEFAKKIVRTGEYIEPGNADKLNIEFLQLSDIKFEYNSAAIKPESYSNLDYVVSMLKLESDFEIKIHAHTCSMGKPDYNLKLSDRRAQSVYNYLLSKGIEAHRMHPRGFGDTQPLMDNETDEGRRQNRRVEFVIVFPQNK